MSNLVSKKILINDEYYYKTIDIKKEHKQYKKYSSKDFISKLSLSKENSLFVRKSGNNYVVKEKLNPGVSLYYQIILIVLPKE